MKRVLLFSAVLICGCAARQPIVQTTIAPVPHVETMLNQEGPYRFTIGPDGKAIVPFSKIFNVMPKCLATPAQVQVRSWSRESAELVGPAGVAGDVTCWQSVR